MAAFPCISSSGSISLLPCCILAWLLASLQLELPRASALSSEGQILLDLKRALTDPSDFLHNWSASSDSPCEWNGVTCSHGVVTGLEFPNFYLRGEVPTTMCRLPNLVRLNFLYNDFGGLFPVELLNCSRLTYLSLAQNLLVGRLPEGINQLNALQFLDLSSNNFSGPIPQGFGQLSELVELGLHSNLLNATIPPFLGQLSRLQHLYLAYNPFTPGPIPSELGKLTQLTNLWLPGCNLVGTIPDTLGNLTKLVNLDLSRNRLRGNIPRTIMNLRFLDQLELYQNELSGSIPENLGNLSRIANIDMSTNQLTGPIPESISQLKNLTSLHLYCNGLSGGIPHAVADLPRLQDLTLFNNSFNGTLPQNLGVSSRFTTFDVSQNQLSGPLPPHICAGGSLGSLAAMQNHLNGTIPESYASCNTLIRFRVSHNQLNGGVPEGLWGMPSLFLLDLAFNKLEGEISPLVGKANNLSIIYLQYNAFFGSLPAEIGNVWNLSVLTAQHNNLSGPIPREFGELKHLLNLQLQYNSFSGEIPDDIGACQQLTIVDLSNNQFTGPIPSSLGYLPNLNSLYLSNNRLSGEIPQSLSKLSLTNFNVSDNSLSGPVPISLINWPFHTSFLENKDLCGENLLDVKACQSGKSLKFLQVALAGTFAAAILILLLGLAWFYKRYWLHIHSIKDGDRLEKSVWNLTSFHKLGFGENEILGSLDEDNVIGSGGAGKVYKATLSNGETVAVKRLWSNGKDEARHDNGFKAEVEILGKIRHKNIVKLLCCCSNKDSNLLVYEYMPNGSLGNLLHGPKASILDWASCYKIALGSAQGLAYLHHDCLPPIVHRDVKSNNILLDSDFEAHVSDFGVAKILESVRGESSTVAGSYGYIAPEHAYTSKVTEKSDIYSFGVVLLELVTGKKPIIPEFGDNTDIVKWVYSKLQDPEGLSDVLDSRFLHSSKDDMLPVLKVALLCTNTLPVRRPSMWEVVEMLMEADPQLKSKKCKIKSSKSFKDSNPIQIPAKQYV